MNTINYSSNQTIQCEGCGILAVAQMEGIPLCTECLLSRLKFVNDSEIPLRVSPLNLSYFLEGPSISGVPA